MRGDLQKALENLGGYDRDHLALVDRLTAGLEAKFKPDKDLWDCCPNAAECWHSKVEKPEAPHRYRIPYVGPRYLSSGVLIVGMNSRDDGKSDAAFRGMAEYRTTLHSGRRAWGGQFQFRAATLVGLLIASQRGESLEGIPGLGELAERLLASARLQAVQCSPVNRARRSPAKEMWSRCPPFVAEAQFQVLKPTAIALLGAETRRRVQALAALDIQWDVPWDPGSPGWARGTAEVGGNERAEIFALYHPAAVGGWGKSVGKLRDSLATRPLRQPV